MRKFNVKVNGQAYEVEVDEIIGGVSSAPVANIATAPVVTTPAPKPVAVSAGNGTQLKAPMPGNIVALKVENGTTVKKGQAVLVLEAMKMENEIASPVDGVITISVVKGATVNSGDVLAVIA